MTTYVHSMTTSDETRDVLGRYAASWQAGDIDGLLGAYADNVVFHYFGATDVAGEHVGKDAAVQAMLAVSGRASRRLVEIVDILAGDSLGSIVAVEELSREDESALVRRVLNYRIENGQIAECWVLDEDQALIDRFWR